MNFFGGDFFAGDFFGQQVVVVGDTHDGERRKRADKARDERIRRYRRDREHLREAIRFAIEGAPAIVAPFVAADQPIAAESAIDFGALLVAAETLRALADWHESVLERMAQDDDDEEVLLLT